MNLRVCFFGKTEPGFFPKETRPKFFAPLGTGSGETLGMSVKQNMQTMHGSAPIPLPHKMNGSIIT